MHRGSEASRIRTVGTTNGVTGNVAWQNREAIIGIDQEDVSPTLRARGDFTAEVRRALQWS
jgi:hypothetical protein